MPGRRQFPSPVPTTPLLFHTSSLQHDAHIWLTSANRSQVLTDTKEPEAPYSPRPYGARKSITRLPGPGSGPPPLLCFQERSDDFLVLPTVSTSSDGEILVPGIAHVSSVRWRSAHGIGVVGRISGLNHQSPSSFGERRVVQRLSGLQVCGPQACEDRRLGTLEKVIRCNLRKSYIDQKWSSTTRAKNT